MYSCTHEQALAHIYVPTYMRIYIKNTYKKLRNVHKGTLCEELGDLGPTALWLVEAQPKPQGLRGSGFFEGLPVLQLSLEPTTSSWFQRRPQLC